jgi:hypothetical protein
MTDYQFPTAAPQAAPPRNGLGTTGFVLGLLGLVLAPIPIVGIVAWPLVIIGLILSFVGLGRARKGRATNKRLAIAGIVLSVLGLIVCIVWVAVIGKVISDVQDQATQQHTVVYELSGDAKTVDVQYTTFGEHTLLIEGESGAALPWTKTVQAKGFLDGGQFTATTGADGGSVTCKVTVDGKVAKTATANGPAAVATCSGF